MGNRVAIKGTVRPIAAATSHPLSIGSGGSITQRALAILRRPGITADVYLPGIGTLSGLTAGNYTLSDGSTGVAAVDGPDGLVLDAAGTVGTELISNPGPFANTTGWNLAGGAALSTSGGNLVVTNGSTLFGSGNTSFPTVVGQTYVATITLASLSGSPSSQAMVGTSSGNPSLGNPTFSAPGTKSIYFVATTTTTFVTLFSGTSVIADSASWSLASVKQVTGIHASQPTAGFRPTLRRGAVNLAFPSAGDLSLAYTSGAGVNKGASAVVYTPGITCGTATKNVAATGARAQKNISVSAATPYTACIRLLKPLASTGEFCALVDGAESNRGVVFNPFTGAISQTFSSSTASIVTDPQNPLFWKISLTYAVVGTLMATGFYPAYNTDGSGSEMTAIGSGYVHTLTATQLEIGSTASDYSPTTTAAASNPNAGRYSWAFDAAAQQRLHLASAPFQSNDDFWIVAPCRVDSSGATQGLFGVSTNVNTGELITLAFNNGKAQLYIATGGVTRQALSTLTYNFTPIVMAARKVGTDCYLNVNGVEVGTFNTVGLPASAFTVSHIGTYMSSAGYFGGALGQVQACKGAITAEQLLIEMRYAAAQFPNGPQF